MQILLKIAYDGTNYAGWQRQENALAVQEVLEDAICKATAADLKLVASSRTDAGVHALAQIVSFYCEDLKIPVDKLPQVINAHLPPDIAVQQARIVEQGFNPRFAAVRKTYEYKFYAAPVPCPLAVRHAAFVSQSVVVEKMQDAAAFFVGTFDFAAFCATGGSQKTTTRTVYECAVTASGPLITLRITGGGFLYNMVRIIAGTVLYAGFGKIDPAAIPEIIASKDRTRAGKTMPPHGLCLVDVEF
jgi:tRNA pseudouridine38-40 synthase